MAAIDWVLVAQECRRRRKMAVNDAERDLWRQRGAVARCNARLCRAIRMTREAIAEHERPRLRELAAKDQLEAKAFG